MADEDKSVLREEYSVSEDHMYEITKNSEDQYDLWMFQYDEKMKGYFFMSDENRLTLETLEEAVNAGNQKLAQLG